MEVARKITLALCEVILLLCIGIFIFSLFFRMTVGNQGFVKSTLSESGIYTVATDSLKKQLSSSNSVTLDTANPIIISAVDQAIKKETIQTFVESGVTQTYAWLDGTTETPVFSVDANQIKTDFANAVTVGLSERANTLPACTTRLRPTSSDVFTINCIPPGTNVKQEIQNVRQQILATDTNQLQNEAPLSAENLSLNQGEQAQPYYQTLKEVPSYYQLLKVSIFIITGVFLLSTLIIILLKRPRYKALRTLAIPFMVYGSLYIIAGYLAPERLGELLETSTKQLGSVEFSSPINFIVTELINQASSIFTKTGIIFFVIGVFCLATYSLIKRKQGIIANPQV